MSGFSPVIRHRLLLLAAFLILSLLPFPSFAETSRDYSPYAPEIDRWPERQPVSAEEIARAPHYSDFIDFVSPWLTDIELAKMREFQAALKDGDITYSGDSIVNPSTVNSQDVAVFTLNPEDFCGESYYVFLPDSQSLSDTQLVALAAAFEDLGIDFDPDSLNDRNCCRHCNVLETRWLTDEENDRMEEIRAKIRRGQLKKEDIPSDTQVLTAEKRTPRTWGLDSKTFLFYPYRRMTDDELALFALMDEGIWDIDPDELQAAALKDTGELINLPGNVRKYNPCTNRELMQLDGDTYLPRSSAVYKYTSHSTSGRTATWTSFSCRKPVPFPKQRVSTCGTVIIQISRIMIFRKAMKRNGWLPYRTGPVKRCGFPEKSCKAAGPLRKGWMITDRSSYRSG